MTGVLALIELVLVLGAAAVDWRRRVIPDGFALGLLACSIAAALGGEHGWTQLALGALVGGAAGCALFALGAWGGGDAKLAIGIGACLGPAPALWAFWAAALAGGALAALAGWRGEREVAYAPALAFGFCAAWVRA